MELHFESITKADYANMRAIADRAGKDNGLYGHDRNTLLMDLVHVHAQCPMDFQKLLAFPTLAFDHDMYGIAANINRTTGQLDNCFLPRCTLPSERHI